MKREMQRTRASEKSGKGASENSGKAESNAQGKRQMAKGKRNKEEGSRK